MKNDFKEGLNSKHADPMDERIINFDYEAVEFTPDIQFKLDAEVKRLESEMAGALRRLAFFVLGQECDVKHSGRRFLALAWVMDPSLFPGTPSLRQLAKRLRMDEGGLSRLTAEVTRVYGIRNRAQSHGDGVRRETVEI